jgi:hypothetical protein
MPIKHDPGAASCDGSLTCSRDSLAELDVTPALVRPCGRRTRRRREAACGLQQQCLLVQSQEFDAAVADADATRRFVRAARPQPNGRVDHV